MFQVISDYIKDYNVETTKLFIDGYSRTAAIAELACTKLIDEDLIKEENLYAYLFETPQGVDASNEKEYKSIFNIINNGDLVTHIAPTGYGLKRVGTDININCENMEEVLTSFNKNLVLPKFTSSSSSSANYSNDKEFIDYLVNYLLEPVTNIEESKPSKDISTRENYVDNLQTDISFIIGLVMSLDSETMNAITTALKELDLIKQMGLFAEDGIFNFLYPILDEHNVVYDKDQLKASSNAAVYLLQQKPLLVMSAINENFRNNMMRAVYLHALEAVLPLLINFE